MFSFHYSTPPGSVRVYRIRIETRIALVGQAASIVAGSDWSAPRAATDPGHQSVAAIRRPATLSASGSAFSSVPFFFLSPSDAFPKQKFDIGSVIQSGLSGGACRRKKSDASITTPLPPFPLLLFRFTAPIDYAALRMTLISNNTHKPIFVYAFHPKCSQRMSTVM